jgi:hypothetical protein
MWHVLAGSRTFPPDDLLVSVANSTCAGATKLCLTVRSWILRALGCILVAFAFTADLASSFVFCSFVLDV